MAAYCARQDLHDDYYGATYRYGHRRHEVLFSTMMAPDMAPDWTRDRQTFWNAVEKAEKRTNSQLAIPYDIALPHELTLEQNISLIREYCEKEFVSRGLVVDLNLHMPDPTKDQRNIHAHILIPTRPVDEHGFGKKPRAKSKSAWEQEREENINRLRKSWAEIHNQHLAKHGFPEITIDHRSYDEQGIEKEPTKHIGVTAQNMEKRGIVTDRGRLKQQQQQDYPSPSEGSSMPDDSQSKIAEEARRKEADRQEQARKAEELRKQQAFEENDKKLTEAGQAHRDQQNKQAEEMRQEQIRREGISQQADAQFSIPDHLQKLETTTDQHRQTLSAQLDNKYLEGDIRDPQARYATALARHYSIVNPYETLARAAMAEHASWREGQETLARAIAKATDPKEREALQTRKQIEAYDYLTITGDRIARQSEIIVGRLNSEEAVKMRENVYGHKIINEKKEEIHFPGYQQLAENLRFDYRKLQVEPTTPSPRTPTKKAQEKTIEPSRPPRPRRQREPGMYARKMEEKTDPEKAQKRREEELKRQQQRERERKGPGDGLER